MKLRLFPKLPDMKVGDLPEVEAFYPTDPAKALALLPLAASTLLASSQLLTNPMLQIASVPAALLMAWLYDRHATRQSRDGYLLDKPWTMGIAAMDHSNTNWEITHLLRSRVPELNNELVTESRTHQYRILKIPNLDPAKVKAQLPAISMKLGIDQARLFWIQNFKPGKSAILVPEDDEKLWKPVPFDTKALRDGELLDYIGESITKQPVILNRRLYPHLLISGMTGAGKTEAFCASVKSMHESGLNPQIIVIDPKNTAQLRRLQADYYTADISQGVAKMETLIAESEVRNDKYSKAGCDNFFEYHQHDPSERPICIYLDEIGKFLREDLMEELEEGEKPRHKRARNVLTTGLEMIRSSGMFVTAGMQVTKATNIPTDIRDNFGARLMFASADENAGRTAGAATASYLQMAGGFIFKTGRKTVIGRGAYLKDS